MSAEGRYFLDTNVFVYTFDDTAPEKQVKARELVAAALRDGRGVISFQVIQEFCNVATRRFATPLAPRDLRSYLRVVLAPLCEVHSSIALYEAGLRIHDETRFSLYDALVVAAAARAECRVLFTEDLPDGRLVGGVRIVDPFADGAL